MTIGDNASNTERELLWKSTMFGTTEHGWVRAHHGRSPQISAVTPLLRVERELQINELASASATRSEGSGNRSIDEEPDGYRTAFEVDRDRILHRTSAFRRLAGKTQVFIFPEDHVRTRLTHALEVAQVATAVTRALRLNVVLAEAIALGHDCGHGPFGHASEDALSIFVEEGYDHAVWGADVVLSTLNLTRETYDGIRNHSWSRPAPSTPEGEIVSWADRVAYVCHDFEDAVAGGLVSFESLPPLVLERAGYTRSRQLNYFITALVEGSASGGGVQMAEEPAQVLAAFRHYNYEQIYNRPASVEQSRQVVPILRSLVEYFIDRPLAVVDDLASSGPSSPGDVVRTAVTHVAGMTDRYAVRQALALLGWDPRKLPKGVDVGYTFVA